MAKRSIYSRLTGRRRGIAGYSQLWLAPDHILLVKSSRFVEQYQRFALADLQALVITNVPDRTPLQIAALAAAILWTLGWFAVSLLAVKIFFAVTGALAVAVVAADIARGPRCRCFLHTAVTRELLAPVYRMRGARQFLDAIRPAIEAVQGSLAPERLALFQASGASAPINMPPEIPQPPGYLPEALFGLFLVDAALVLAGMRFPHTQITNVLPTTFFGEIVILVVALIRRGPRDPRRVIYILMIAAIVCIGWDVIGIARSFGGYLEAVGEAARRNRGATPFTLTLWVPFETGAGLFAASWRIVAGVAGLAAAWIERPAERAK